MQIPVALCTKMFWLLFSWEKTDLLSSGNVLKTRCEHGCLRFGPALAATHLAEDSERLTDSLLASVI